MGGSTVYRARARNRNRRKKQLGQAMSTRQSKDSHILPRQKKVRGIAWVILAFSALFLASCGSQTGMVRLSTLDNGKTVQMLSGDQVMIQLNENPSTGYW